MAVKLTFEELTNPELLELSNRLDPTELTASRPVGGIGRPGALDPVTATVIVSSAALVVLAQWLLKTRRGQRIRRRVVIEHPDGRRVVDHFEVELKSENPEVEVVEALNGLVYGQQTSGDPEGNP